MKKSTQMRTSWLVRIISTGLLVFASLAIVDLLTIKFFPDATGPLTFIEKHIFARAQTAAASSPISTSLNGRLMVGYQGWFAYPGAPAGWNSFTHWSRNGAIPSANNLVVDMWPDLTGFAASELRATSLTLPTGAGVSVYGANAATIQRHVQWMASYNIDGAFIQRFVVMLPTSTRALPDAVIKNFKTSAEARNRTYAVMYDLSGATESTIVSLIQQDWIRLADQGHLNSRSYQLHKGYPIVGIWGVGYANRPLSAQTVQTLIKWFKEDAPVQYRASVMLGVDTGWRTGTGDAAPFASWQEVYTMADVISPWTVGRLANEQQIVNYYETTAAQDKSYLQVRNIDLLPVIYPGFSWKNLGAQAGAQSNAIPRRGGNFLWWQVREAKARNHTMLYAAMFDEIDEGTALYKTVAKTSDLPQSANLIALDVDGYPLPSDWYLQILKKTRAVLGGQAWAPLSIPQPNTIGGFVENLYRNILDRGSDTAGKQNHVAFLTANRTVASCQSLMLAFYDSGEFQARTLSNTEFVSTLYRAVLGREPDAAGLSAWANQITNGAVTRAQVRDMFMAHAEAVSFCSRALGL